MKAQRMDISVQVNDDGTVAIGVVVLDVDGTPICSFTHDNLEPLDVWRIDPLLTPEQEEG